MSCANINRRLRRWKATTPPAAKPCNSTALSKASIWAKFNSDGSDVTARQTNSVQLDFDQYVAQAPISRSSCPMHWWAQHKPSYLILSSVAQTMFCVPATSIASERVFLHFFAKPAMYHMQKKYAGTVKSQHCHFSDGQYVTVALLLGR